MLTCLFLLFVHCAYINPNLAFWSIFVAEKKLVCGFDNLLVREYFACIMVEHVECHISVARGGACWECKVFGRLLDLGFRPNIPRYARVRPYLSTLTVLRRVPRTLPCNGCDTAFRVVCA